MRASNTLRNLWDLFVYYANAFILFGRMLGFLWCIATGLVLAFGRRESGARA